MPSAASAAPGDHSEAQAQFLSGSILDGIDLASVVGLAGTEAINTGGATVTDTTDLDLAALSLLQVVIPSGVSIPLGDLLELGAVNQFSQAAAAGISRAGSGAVSDQGIVDTTGTGAFPASASLDLMSLLPSTPLLTEANVTLSGVTGVAAQDAAQGALATSCADLSAPVNCRGYNIVGATSNLASPAVGAIATTTQSALGTLSTTLNGLSDEIIGGLLGGVTDSLSAINALLPGVSLISNDLDVTVSANLAAALDPVLGQDITVGGVTLNASAGTVTVDWENVVGLNGLPPNTPLISATTLTTVATNAAAALTQLQTELNTALNGVTDNVNVQISGGVCLLQVIGCTAGLDLSFNGSLADLLDGSADLGVAGTGLASVLSPILTTLSDTIQGATSLVVLPLVTTALSTAGTAIAGAVSAAATALSGAFDLIGDVISIDLNVQEEDVDGPDTSTEVAARLTLLGGTAVTVDLGKAVVGANVVAAVASIDAPATVQAGTSLAVTGTNWPAGPVQLQLTAPGGGSIGGPVTATALADGTFSQGYPVPASTPAATGYTITATAGALTATDTVEVTAAAPPGDVNTNASASASASADATADGDPSAQAAAEASAMADNTSQASAAADVDATAAASAAANTDVDADASASASTDATSAANAQAVAAAQASALANADDDVNAAATAAATADVSANSAASASVAATADANSSADASSEASANANAAASASASANADASTAAVAQAAAQAAAFADSDATSSASADTDADATAAAAAAANAAASTTATSDATSAANANAAVAAQAAAMADNSSTTDADTSASAAANANAGSAAEAAALATSSTDASTAAVGTATAAADPNAQTQATTTSTSTSTATATSSADSAADPSGGLSLTLAHPTLRVGQQQTAVGRGFEPGEVVSGVMSSPALALGTQVANQQGTVTFTWAIPAGTDLGAHTVTLSGDSGTVAGTFQVVAQGLAATGGSLPNGWVILGALLVMLGLGTALVARPRRAGVAAE
ncbi:choice-of-anchor G family protein [Streptomyces sp. AC495_CC817]|uniref:choice-of-anchor G family protein n=1 Tax=Streptomyces sp. AC495_CC817 TaxID=2823900 RepID=UPI001C273E1F|nr:choice-of-anchor G family protein [Streptomyces sp. AC495_CC817]